MNFTTHQAHLTHNTIFKLDEATFIKAHLITDDSLDMGFPAIVAGGTSADDPSSVITFVYSSPNHFPGTALIYHNRYGEYSDIVKVKKGQSLIYYSFIPKGEQRWGDYEGIQAKYDEPGIYYLVGSYGKTNNMHAWIARVRLKDGVWKSPVADVKVFPNPAVNDNDLQIEIRLPQEGVYKLGLTNMIGESIKTDRTYYLEAGTNLLSIHPSDLASGVYWLVIKDGNGKSIVSQKVVIQ